MAGGDQRKPFNHPELVSGPILPLTRSKRRQTQPRRQIRPMRVVLVDQIDFPRSMPAFQLLLAQDRRFHLAEQFVVNEAMDAVPAGVPRQCVVAVLPKPGNQVRRDPDVERTVKLARKDVDAGETFLRHGPEFAARWALKQVQGDEIGIDSAVLEESASSRAIPISPVTLNLFQGPFRGLLGACADEQRGDVGTKPVSAGFAAQWALKQVQGDEIGKDLTTVVEIAATRIIQPSPISHLPVTLNLFQGPFRSLPGACADEQRGDVGAKPLSAGFAAQWALKQVQGDDDCWAALQ